MTARDHFDLGIKHLGYRGTPKDLWAAREAFGQATEVDPGMCDAWMGLATAGDVTTATLRGAYNANPTLHRETRRIGLADSALTPTVSTPLLIDLYPHTPAGIGLAYVAALLHDADYDTADTLLQRIDLTSEAPEQAQIHRFLGASLHHLTQRWTDVITWTSCPASSVNGVVDAATVLLKGIAQTGLGKFEAALTTLQALPRIAEAARLDGQAVDTQNILAQAAFHRGLCQRALHNESAARAEFSAAIVDGELCSDAAAALDDPTYGAMVTTADAIAARTRRWDPNSGPSSAELRQAQQRQAAQHVLDRAQHELDEFVGLQRVKEHVNELKYAKIYDQKMAERGVQIGQRETLHMTLVGPPGTAKTSIARLICEMYFGLGILESPEFIEVSREQLVGAVIGETEAKTSAVLESARGRALFIDEAPELYKPDLERDFGHIALNTMMKFAEDHRDDTMIALAGYAAPMNLMLAANPGLRSRFPYQLEFSSNTPDELLQIAELFASRSHVNIHPEALAHFSRIVEWLCTTPSTTSPDAALIDIAANGRFVRSVIEQATRKAKVRNAADPTIDLLTADIDTISAITCVDMDSAISDVLAANNIIAP
uniref:ESX-1 secretion system protein EccA1 n=1 Tax=Mycobacterium riyadhense TaxID=486698 RepID=A0A653F4A9_9MYCO|nr:ESX-1 secretion system protein EccA1 [Mycobacterium riyadhense]